MIYGNITGEMIQCSDFLLSSNACQLMQNVLDNGLFKQVIIILENKSYKLEKNT